MQKFVKLFVLAMCLTFVGALWANSAKGPVANLVGKNGTVMYATEIAQTDYQLPAVGTRRPGSLDEIIISENFDALTPGTLPAGWIMVDVDNANCSDANWPFDQSEWTVLGAPFAAHSGTNTVANVYNDGAVPNNDWLILPQQNLTGEITLSFWAASQQSPYLETFAVKVSTTGTQPANFTNTIQTFTNIPTTWTQHTLDLSQFAGAPFYVAFHHTSIDMWVLKIDDILLEAGAAGPTGTISGTVTREGTATPISGAMVQVQGGPSATTNATGNYSVIVPVGTHAINVTAPNYEPESVTGIVVAQDQATDVDVTMTPFGTVTGTVTAMGTGTPIAGATVGIQGGPSAVSNASGVYTLSVAAGTYTLNATATNYENETLVGVVVASGQATTANIEMIPSSLTTTNFPSAATPLSIPDNSPTGATKSLVINADHLIEDIDVTVNITHTWITDLSVWLISPWSDTVLLALEPEGVPNAGANMTNCRFDDEADSLFDYLARPAPYTGSWRPVEELSAFDGFSSQGTWGLRAVDYAAQDTGSIRIFVIHITHEAGSAIGDRPEGVPTAFALHAAYPNPFNPSTRIEKKKIQG